VARARRSITVASFLFWYLLTELGDDAFGPRASIVQVEGRGRAGQGRAGWLAGCLAGWLLPLLLVPLLSPPTSPHRPPAPACPPCSLPSLGLPGSRPAPPRNAFTSRSCSWRASNTSLKLCR
jgi:hypothetical protein